MTNKVSLIGLGALGSALARALLRDGREVTVWNRTASRADALATEGAHVAATPAAAVSASPIVLVCVDDYAVTRGILEGEGVSEALHGKLLVQLSTGSPQDARTAEAWAKDLGADYLDGAILATPSQIGRPDTPIFVSGSEAAFGQAEPVLKSIGGAITYLGETIGAAGALDSAVLCYIFGGALGFFHGAQICESEGLSVSEYGKMVAALTPIVGEMLQQEAENIVYNRFEDAESSIAICARSMELFIRQAEESGINGEFPAFANAIFQKAMHAGYGSQQLAAVIKVLRSG